MELENIGGGRAVEIGIETRFYFIKFVPIKAAKEAIGVRGLYSYDSAYATDKTRNLIVSSIDFVNFASYNKNKEFVIDKSKKASLDIEPNFEIQNHKKGFLGKLKRVGNLEPTLKALISEFEKYDKRYIAFNFTLVYKNIIGDVMPPRNITTFIFDKEFHKNLGDASKSNWKPDYLQLDLTEARKIVGMDYEYYANAKWTGEDKT